MRLVTEKKLLHLDSPEPEMKLLLILASEVQGPQLIVLFLFVYQGEREACKLGHRVALEDLSCLS